MSRKNYDNEMVCGILSQTDDAIILLLDKKRLKTLLKLIKMFVKKKDKGVFNKKASFFEKRFIKTFYKEMKSRLQELSDET